jgi:hypothetical protein
MRRRFRECIGRGEAAKRNADSFVALLKTAKQGRTPHLNSLSANEVGGLESLGKRRKEFAGRQRPDGAERAGASKSLGRGEVVLKSPLRSLRNILAPRFAAGRGKRPLQCRTMFSTEQQLYPRITAAARRQGDGLVVFEF